jgi:hypothetical protein
MLKNFDVGTKKPAYSQMVYIKSHQTEGISRSRLPKIQKNIKRDLMAQ